MRTPRPLTWLLLALAPASIALALIIGSTPIGVGSLWRVLAGADTGVEATVILELRLPRALNAFAVGGLLALAGVLMQVLLRNPLADPYILGVSGGAAVAALLTLLAGLSGLWVTGNAFAGALASMLLVFGLARVPGEAGSTRLLLTGVVIAAGWGALISLILAVSPQAPLHGLLFWLLGDLSRNGGAGWAFWALAAGLGVAFSQARSLNLLARGEGVAASLGAQIGRLRALVYLLASLLTAAAVSVAGTIGFVGLVIPHALRLLGDTDHRRLLPDAVLAGGSFLVVADTLARSLLAPQQLPVGVITALLGVPVFLMLLHHGARR